MEANKAGNWCQEAVGSPWTLNSEGWRRGGGSLGPATAVAFGKTLKCSQFTIRGEINSYATAFHFC